MLWIIETPSGFYGPFKTARAAEKWGRKEMSLCKWKICLLVGP